MPSKDWKEKDIWTNNPLKKHFSNPFKCSRKLLKCEPEIFTYIPCLHYSISLGSQTGAQNQNRAGNWLDSLVRVLTSEWSGCGYFYKWQCHLEDRDAQNVAHVKTIGKRLKITQVHTLHCRVCSWRSNSTGEEKGESTVLIKAFWVSLLELCV